MSINYAILVYLNDGTTYWQIGYTDRSVEERLNEHKKKLRHGEKAEIMYFRPDCSKKKQEALAHAELNSELLSKHFLGHEREEERFLNSEFTRNYLRKNFSLYTKENKTLPEISENCCIKPIDLVFRDLRAWQKEVFEDLKDKNFSIINANVAAGKTIASKAIISYALEKEENLKVVIVVPSENIINNFYREEYFLDENGKTIHWSVNFRQNGENINEFMDDFYSRKNKHAHNRIAVITHSAFRNISDITKFKNTLFLIDEAHHLDAENENEIGKTINSILDETNNKIMLMTATLYRTNGSGIIAERHKDKFKEFHYPVSRYFKDTEFIKDFDLNFSFTQGDFSKEIYKKYENYNKDFKDIIFIPSANNLGGLKNSEENVNALYKAILQTDKLDKNNVKYDEETGLTLLYRKGFEDNPIRVLNFVKDGAKRKKCNEYLKNSQGDKNFLNYDNIDIIININVLSEGTDWFYANRVFILGRNRSVLQFIQRVGRVLRDSPNKENKPPEVEYILPFSCPSVDTGIDDYKIDDFLNIFSLVMLLEDATKENNRMSYLTRNSGDAVKTVDFKVKVQKIFLGLIFKDNSLEALENKEILIQEAASLYLKEYPKEKYTQEDIYNDIEKEYESLRDFALRLRKKNQSKVLKLSGMESKIDYSHKPISIMDGFNFYAKSSNLGSTIQKISEQLHKLQNQSQEFLCQIMDECMRYSENEGNGKYPPPGYIFNRIDVYYWNNNIKSFRNEKTSQFCIDYANKNGHPKLFEKSYTVGDDNDTKNIEFVGEFPKENNGNMPSNTKENQELKNKEYYAYAKWIRLVAKYEANNICDDNIELGKEVHKFFWEGPAFIENYNRLKRIMNFIIKYKRNPSQGSSDPEEVKVARDLNETRQSQDNSIGKRVKNHPIVQAELEEAGLSNIWDKKETSSPEELLDIAQRIKTRDNKITSKSQIDGINFGEIINIQRKASLLKGNSVFNTEADKLLNENGFAGLFRAQRSSEVNSNKEWQPGLGRGISWDMGWKPGTTANEWYEEVQNMSQEEIKERKIDVEFAKKEYEKLQARIPKMSKAQRKRNKIKELC